MAGVLAPKEAVQQLLAMLQVGTQGMTARKRFRDAVARELYGLVTQGAANNRQPASQA